MKHPYAHILEPVRINDVILKNRIFATKCLSQDIQGPENFPAEASIQYLEDIAKNGAAMVVCPIGSFPQDRGKSGFTSEFEMENIHVLRYFSQEVKRIHGHNCLAIGGMMCALPQNVAISEIRHPELLKGAPPEQGGPHGMAGPQPEITKEEIKAFIDNFAGECAAIRTIGFDGVNIYMSYNTSILAKSLSPVYNQREDEYGGSPENRARLTLELFREIKRRCGKNFLIECQISGEEDMPGGYTVDDFLSYCMMAAQERLVDIFEIRAKNMTLAHTSSYSSPEHYPTTLKYAEAFKKRKIPALCAPVGGFQDLEDIERFLAEGKADMIAMARAFICDPNYGRKLYQGRNDFVPCIRCDKCHGAVCSVNPLIGLSHAERTMYPAPEKHKRVAVIGGGPAGMLAALVADSRGHDVVLYEEKDHLGGQLIHADYIERKWSLRNYNHYLISQLEASKVQICMGVRPTKEYLETAEYDAVIVACGSQPKAPPVPGGDDPMIWKPIDCFGREGELGEKVTVVGGASTACETALYLAQTGHNVTIVTRKDDICYDNLAHGRDFEVELIKTHPNINIVSCAKTLRVENGKDIIVRVNVSLPEKPDGPMFGPPPPMPDPADDAKLSGQTVEKKIEADSLVFSAGVAPRVDACMEYAGTAPEFYVIGDANVHTEDMWRRFDMPQTAPTVGGNVKHCTATAFAAAMQL